MKVGIMQPYFFPYLGYFQLVHAVDRFVFYDDVNFIKKGWIHRNQLLLQGQAFLFHVPLIKQSQNKSIRDTQVAWSLDFPKVFLQQLQGAYAKAPQFKPVMALVEQVLDSQAESIADLAANSVRQTYAYLGLEKEFLMSSALPISQGLGRAERLMAITAQLGSKEYINAQQGMALYHKEDFAKHGIQLNFIQAGLPEYQQGSVSEFVPSLSILDLLMWNAVSEVRAQLNAYTLI